MGKRKITQDRLKQVLSYNEMTGHFVWTDPTGNRVVKGSAAGCVSRSTGYLIIGVDGKRWAAATLAWIYVTGRMPNGVIDHISRDRLDNRFCNLRDATTAQNAANSSVHRDSQFGLKGIEAHPQTGKWRARICVNGRRMSLGLHETPEMAHAAYLAAAAKSFGEYATGGGNR